MAEKGPSRLGVSGGRYGPVIDLQVWHLIEIASVAGDNSTLHLQHDGGNGQVQFPDAGQFLSKFEISRHGLCGEG